MKLVQYVREVRAELKKVVWPTWARLRRDTIVVIVAIIAAAIFVSILDLIFQTVLLNWILNIGSTTGTTGAALGLLPLC